MATGLDRLLKEFSTFVAPLSKAAQSENALSEYLAGFGYRLDTPAQINGAYSSLATLWSALADLTAKLAALPSPASAIQTADVVSLLSSLSAVFAHVRTAEDALKNVAIPDIEAGFFDEVLDDLTIKYLHKRAEIALAVLEGIGVFSYEARVPGSTDGRQIDYVRTRVVWSLLRTLIEDSPEWARVVYGWGDDFDAGKALERAARIVDALDRASRFETMTSVQEAILLPGAATGAERPRVLLLPILQLFDFAAVPPSTNGHDAPKGTVEAGLLLAPCGDAASGETLGLGLAPYATAAIDQQFQVSPSVALKVKASADASFGAVFSIAPGQPPTIKGVSAAAADFDFGFKSTPANGPIHLYGGNTGSRLEADSFHFAIGGRWGPSLDMFLAAGVENLRMILEFSEDGFLSKVVSGSVEVTVGSILAGWRPGRGVYFEGGDGLSVTVPVERQTGPMKIHDLSIGLDWSGDPSLQLTITADAQLGPLYAYVQNAGVIVSLTPAINGVLGKYDLDFSLKKPTGYAV